MIKRTALLAIVLVISAACGPQPLPEAPTPIPTLAPATMPVQAATTQPTQPASAGETAAPSATADLVQAGSQVFQQDCSVCHNLTAERKVGPGLAGLFSISTLPNGQPFSEANLEDWIRSGGGGMPGFQLSDEQMTALIAFLKDATG
jgi:mono/diheme cytochrome c family protein